MTIDLSKLTPAPWMISKEGNVISVVGKVADWDGSIKQREDEIMANSNFVVLARNAFDGDPESLAWWEENRKVMRHPLPAVPVQSASAESPPAEPE